LNVEGKEVAAEFLKETFGSNVEFYQELVTDIGAIGTLKAAANGDAYTKADEFFGGQTTISDLAAWTEQIPRVNYGIHTYAIDDILVVEMQNYLNGTELNKALSNAQSQAESQIR